MPDEPYRMRVEITVDVVDERLLRAYTSGFLPEHVPLLERVSELLAPSGAGAGRTAHVLNETINGVRIAGRQVVLNPDR